MKIHGICLLKNEADIVEYSLRENARWCDHIYVYDNDSSDGTMERVQALARELPQIVPFGVCRRPFVDGLRADVFNHFKSQAAAGDWWCRLDADEIYVGDVRESLRRVPAACHLVWSIYLQFYPTELDLPKLLEMEARPPAGANAENLPRHYFANYAEPKFFRHRAKLEWPDGAWPRHVGLTARAMLRHKHFQYRSPAQIEMRLRTRQEAARHGHGDFPHSSGTWREKIESSKRLHLDRGDGRYVIETAELPPHLEPRWQRGMKRTLQALGVWP